MENGTVRGGGGFRVMKCGGAPEGGPLNVLPVGGGTTLERSPAAGRVAGVFLAATGGGEAGRPTDGAGCALRATGGLMTGGLTAATGGGLTGVLPAKIAAWAGGTLGCGTTCAFASWC